PPHSHLSPVRRYMPRPSCSPSQPPPAEPYPLSLHDALPIFPPDRPGPAQPTPHVVSAVRGDGGEGGVHLHVSGAGGVRAAADGGDRKSTRLNSSHVKISYAVFCLKKKKTHKQR